MQYLNLDEVRSSLIDITDFPTEYRNGEIVSANESLLEKIGEMVELKSGFSVCHGMNKLLERHGLSLFDKDHAEIGRRYLEGIFRTFAATVNVQKYSPIEAKYTHVARMDVDGYHKNKNFTPNNDHTESREFVTTKCIHFDSATTFIGNIYGPNVNISGGFPIICDTRRYCADKGIRPELLIENIPNNYNVAVREEYYNEILKYYSFGLKIDLTKDMILIVLYNEVIGGLAHAATPPFKTVEDLPAARPITHIEYQFADLEDVKKWYDRYDLDLSKATDHDEEIVLPVLDYHKSARGSSQAFTNFIEIAK